MDKKARKKLNISGVIIALILGMVFLNVIFNVASDLIPDTATAYHNFTESGNVVNSTGAHIGTNTDYFGSDADAFLRDSDSYLGWFWVLGPFILGITLVLAMFKLKKGRR